MEGEEALLDTPKKLSLQQQSKDLRGALKEFERLFAVEKGRKPKQADIKLELGIAAKYKEYHKIQDVLAGRLPLEQLNSASCHSTNKSKPKKHTRTDSGIGSSPQKQGHIVYATPKKNRRAQTGGVLAPEQELNTSDFCLVNTIGPTPHRDGKVLGLFDLMSSSGSMEGVGATPSSSVRKRKIEELYEDTPAKRLPLQVIQTPSHRSPRKKQGDLLEFLTGTPQKCSGSMNKRSSRTPQSDGRKFELSQFFATPSAQRFLFTDHESARKDLAPPPVDPDVNCTPEQRVVTTGVDMTPAYLRRSTSFKDRLLSASQAPSTCDTVPCVKRPGPPTLQHFRSSTSNILKVTQIQQPKSVHDNDDYDDDLDALREFEDDGLGSTLLIHDSQANIASAGESDREEDQPTRHYKKKGQKRTTRKANIKPVASKSTTQPKFVAPDGFDSDREVEDIRAVARPGVVVDDDEYGSDFKFTIDDAEVVPGGAAGKTKASQRSDKRDTDSKNKKKAGMINPNAQSHTNYRSLKIKNKGSKAKGAGRNRFGRGRR